MRLKRVLQNGIVGSFRQILIILLGLINRTVFIRYLGLEYLGYTSLFTNVLTWVAFVEGGFSTVVEYRLYQASAEKDDVAIATIIKLYRKIYCALAVVIFLIGISITGLVPFLIKDEEISLDILSLYQIYWLQLAVVAIGYIGSYWRALLQSKQQAYICEGVDSAVGIFIQIVQIAILIYRKDLYAYLAIKVIEVIIKNFIITKITYKKYPQVLNMQVSAIDIRKSGIFFDLKNFVFQRISYMIYAATDSIVISRFCGIISVGIFSNYQLILNNVRSVLFTAPMSLAQASISDFLNTESEEGKQNLFGIMDILVAIYAAALCCGYLACFQPTMIWWLGTNSTLSIGFVVLLTLNTYIEFISDPIYRVRATYGEYQRDRNWVAVSAIANIILSLVLVQKWGIIGVEVGTIVGSLCMFIGRIKFVITHGRFFDTKKYICKRFIYAAIFIFEAGIILFVTRRIAISLVGILFRGFLAVTISCGISVFLLYKTTDFQIACLYFKSKFLQARRKRNT